MSLEQESDLVRKQYATDNNLRIRQETHEKYTVPNKNYVEWALEMIQWRGDERILDVGCGPGLYYSKLHENQPNMTYHGLDLLPGMLLNHPASNDHLMLGDVHHLPLASESYDVLMANHMLYHVHDVESSLEEMKRVLKPDGVLMVATNSVQTMPELQVLMRRAIVLLTRHGVAQVRAPFLSSDRFALENGTRILSRYFYGVVRYDLPSALVFPDVEPAMAYLESTRDMREPQLPDDVVWEDVMMIMRQQINQLIKHLGELVIRKESGVLIASDRGGFMRQFVDAEDTLSNAT